MDETVIKLTLSIILHYMRVLCTCDYTKTSNNRELLDLTRSATLHRGFCQIPMLFSFTSSHFDDEIG